MEIIQCSKGLVLKKALNALKAKNVIGDAKNSLSQQSACQNYGPTMQVDSSSTPSERVYSELFFIIVRINKILLLVLGQVVIPLNVASTQSCLISFKLLLQDLKFYIVSDNGVSLQKIVVYMKFPKEVTAVGANRSFYPNFVHALASQICTF